MDFSPVYRCLHIYTVLVCVPPLTYTFIHRQDNGTRASIYESFYLLHSEKFEICFHQSRAVSVARLPLAHVTFSIFWVWNVTATTCCHREAAVCIFCVSSLLQGDRETFENYYRKQRKKQARLVLQPQANMVSKHVQLSVDEADLTWWWRKMDSHVGEEADKVTLIPSGLN